MYEFCKKMIELGRTDGLDYKMSVLFMSGQLSDEEYKELSSMLNGN